MNARKMVQDCRCSVYNANMCLWSTLKIVDKHQYRCTSVAVCCSLFCHVVFVTQCADVASKWNPASILCSLSMSISFSAIVIIIGQAQVADLFQFGCCHQAIRFFLRFILYSFWNNGVYLLYNAMLSSCAVCKYVASLVLNYPKRRRRKKHRIQIAIT